MTAIVNLLIELEGNYCNHWPNLEITVNDLVIFDGVVEGLIQLEKTVSCLENNLLKFRHYGKRFGDLGVWDTDTNQGLDCFVKIADICFDGVSAGTEILSKLQFNTVWTQTQLATLDPEFIKQYSSINSCNGMLNFNGAINLEFQTPVYNWLTLAKYRGPVSGKESYFSNHSIRWNYDQDLVLLEEIRNLMGIDENCRYISTKD